MDTKYFSNWFSGKKVEALHLCDIEEWVLCLDENNENILITHKEGLRPIGQNEFGLMHDHIRSIQQFVDGEVESLLIHHAIDAQMDESEREAVKQTIRDRIKKIKVMFLLLGIGMPCKSEDA